MFFKTKKRLWINLSKICKRSDFLDNYNTSISSLLIDNLSLFKQRKENPWNLIFYSRIPDILPTQSVCILIKTVDDFVRYYNLDFSLNEVVNRKLGFEEPLLLKFFHWGSSSIDVDLIKTLIACGFLFSDDFINEALSLTQGYRSFCTESGEETWSFNILLNLARDSKVDFVLNESNKEYLLSEDN